MNAANRIPMLDLVRQQGSIRERLLEGVLAVVSTGQYVPRLLPPEPSTPFEEAFAAYCDRAYVVGVGSGTAALELALLALSVGPGEEVVTAPNSFFGSTEAILRVGARPVFVDVDPRTHLIDVDAIEGALTPATRAILPVHLYGNVVDTAQLADRLARRGRADIAIVEDCAHASGAALGTRRVPVAGVGAFSFNPTKNLSGLGDGGAVVTDDAEVAQRVRALGNHGRSSGGEHAVAGFNSRLNLLNDRVLAIKLDYLDGWNERRRQIAARYDEVFSSLSRVELTVVPPGVLHARHQYVVCVEARDDVRRHLHDAGIATGVHYPRLIPDCEALAGSTRAAGVPVAATLNPRILSLPCHSELTDDEAGQVVNALAAAVRETVST